MKILIVTDPVHNMIVSQPGKTMAEKKSYADQMLSKNYVGIIQEYAGKWMDVDMQYLFTHSFNAKDVGGKILDVQQNIVAAVCIQPEFESVNAWIAKVQERYDKDWPGTDCTKEMIYWKDRIIVNDPSSMSKDNAQRLLKMGFVMTHRYFTDDEWVKADPDHAGTAKFLRDEKNILLEADEFWYYRQEANFNFGWSVKGL